MSNAYIIRRGAPSVVSGGEPTTGSFMGNGVAAQRISELKNKKKFVIHMGTDAPQDNFGCFRGRGVEEGSIIYVLSAFLYDNGVSKAIYVGSNGRYQYDNGEKFHFVEEFGTLYGTDDEDSKTYYRISVARYGFQTFE